MVPLKTKQGLYFRFFRVARFRFCRSKMAYTKTRAWVLPNRAVNSLISFYSVCSESVGEYLRTADDFLKKVGFLNQWPIVVDFSLH